MISKNTYYKIFLHSLRTAFLMITGFLIYEILKLIEDEWNKIHPNNELKHLAKRKLLHFILIFIIDLIILLIIAFLIGDV
jgi:hypothetical protein